MPNYCSFTFTVTGPDTDLKAFKADVESDMEKVEKGELYVPQREYIVNLEHWGNQVQRFFWGWPGSSAAEPGEAVDPADGPVHLRPGSAVIMGDAVWGPPIEFMHLASEKYPLFSLSCTSWIDDSEYEHWTSKDGNTVRVEHKWCDSMTGEIQEWEKNGKAVSREEIDAYNEEIKNGECRRLEERFQKEVDSGLFDTGGRINSNSPTTP